MPKYLNHIVTDRNIVVIFDDKVRMCPSTPTLVTSINKAIAEGKQDTIISLIDLATHISMHPSGKFGVRNNDVLIDNMIVPKGLGDRVVQFAQAGIDFDPLIRFWKNLKNNPSEESRKDLYGFLEHNHIALTNDGCFIAYKRITEDWKDCHTRTTEHKIGSVITMDRKKVNPDRTQTCSSGLHVAAYEYAHNFYTNGILIEVKVNPKDVVSVPIDYNNQKMRVCEYTVVRECSGPREEILYPKIFEYDYIDGIDNDEDDVIVELTELIEVNTLPSDQYEFGIV